LTAKICVSIQPETAAQALNLIKKIENHKANFIEVRLDSLKDPEDLEEIANHTKMPMVATNRSTDCHGKFSGSETDRQHTLLNAARNGFDYVDIELSTPKLKEIVKALRNMNVKPIVSFHDFKGTPSLLKLHKVLENELANEAEVCKIVTTANVIEDNLTVLNFVSKVHESANIVCFSMGELGKPSRLLSPLFGGFFTIASPERGKETAPGQLTVQEMRTAYKALGLA
jgi:3-dehydroquinate dehydratase type I